MRGLVVGGDALFEILETLAQALSQTGELAGSKNQEGDEQNEKKLGTADASHLILDERAQPLGVNGVGELAQRLGLDLPDSLAGERKLLPHLF
jgi:hypothetical protein